MDRNCILHVQREEVETRQPSLFMSVDIPQTFSVQRSLTDGEATGFGLFLLPGLLATSASYTHAVPPPSDETALGGVQFVRSEPDDGHALDFYFLASDLRDT